jgi:hypothetical protein
MLDTNHSSLYFVAFLDLLGFKNMVIKDLEAPTGAEKYMDKLYTIHQKTIELSKSTLDIELVQFSDSIVLATKYDKASFSDFLNIIGNYQRTLLSEGILVRGGIAYGKHFNNNGFIYSNGLINAYKLESEVAKFPRIIVSRDLLELLYEKASYENESLALIKEHDDHYFIDYLSDLSHEEISTNLAMVHKGLKHTSSSVREKYTWLSDYIAFKFPELAIGGSRFVKECSNSL